ncbi:MAG TPA: hypothetical protein PK040_05890 [Anaerolineaceae bacterium]|nr:hypothetical protein [Anaerolineaceae bacterium]
MNINPELLMTVIGFVLTLLVFSYLLGDNPFFRFVSALFVGVMLGYFTVIILYQVILPKLVAPLYQGNLLTLIPAVLSGLLLLKLSPRLAPLGNTSMAVLVGVGAAVAVGGAVLGTLFGQVKGALAGFNPTMLQGGAQWVSLAGAGLFLLGTISSLVYFHFSARKNARNEVKRPWLVSIFAWIGKFFIAVTLGAVFAGVLTSAVTALVERTGFLLEAVSLLFK